ncbi:MAG: sulfatase-like hydrolase/transferase [Candidatus Obscuribacterales bacterium]|nr:sulfatase-like hydrolase/transferase [Steroidobacteraceae bacterium]
MPSLSTAFAILATFGLLYALARRPITAVATTGYLLVWILIASWVKQANIGVALTLADIGFFFLRPAENFKLFLNYPRLGLILVLLAVGAIACVLIGARIESPTRMLSRPKVGGYVRMSMVLVPLAIALSASMFATQKANARANDGDAYAAFLAMYEMQNVDGVIARLNVFFNNRSMEATLPELRETNRFAFDQGSTSNAVGVLPDIMLVLEESTFDTTLIKLCPVGLCDNAMMYPPPRAVRNQQGPLLVHTTGGGTWLAEFAIMSGFDWRAFGRGGAYAPVSLAPRLQTTLPKHLRSLGYRTIAIYPTDGNFLSAQSAYDDYGFDEFYDRRALGLPDEWTDTRDRMVFDKTLALVHQKIDSRPIFVFVLTIRNHGPHGKPLEKLPSQFRPVAKQMSERMADYLARLRESSQDYVALADVWLAAPRPRVIGWFGDHQPEAAWEFTENLTRLDTKRIAANVARSQTQYLTYYQFTGNFGIENTVTTHDALDLSYLGGELLAFAGLPLDAGTQAGQTVSHACHGLMFDCADRALISDYLSYRVYDLHAVQ